MKSSRKSPTRKAKIHGVATPFSTFSAMNAYSEEVQVTLATAVRAPETFAIGQRAEDGTVCCAFEGKTPLFMSPVLSTEMYTFAKQEQAAGKMNAENAHGRNDWEVADSSALRQICDNYDKLGIEFNGRASRAGFAPWLRSSTKFSKSSAFAQLPGGKTQFPCDTARKEVVPCIRRGLG